MKRISILLATFAVIGLLALAVWAGTSDKAQVGFTLEQYFSLEIKQGDSVEFGAIDPLAGPYAKNNATRLRVTSNTAWTLSTSEKVLSKPSNANNDAVLNALSVQLETASGQGNDDDIKVDYTLSNLDQLPAGDYVVEVTFTGSTK